MKYYKELLLTKLVDSGWELKGKDDDTDWWLESYWTIQSIKQNYGFEIFILFLVDPHYDGMDKETAVWAVGAFDEVPLEYRSDEEICVMDFVKGKLEEKLTKFVGEINEHRNTTNS